MTHRAGGHSILLVLPWAGVGGTERQVESLVRCLPGSWDMTVAMPEGPARERILGAGARDSGVVVPYPMGVRGFLRTAMALRRLAASTQVDVVHVHASRELAFALGPVAPLVFTPHAHASAVDVWAAARLGGAAARRVICLTEGEKDLLIRAGLSPERVSLVPNGVRIPMESELSVRAQARNSAPVVVGALARLHPDKGLDALIRAVAELTRRREGLVELRVAGSGGDLGRLQRLVKALGLSSVVTFLGAVAEPVVFLGGVDIFASPSKRETFGLAALEAMACALPVVLTPVGIAPEVVRQGETGLMVGVGDAAGLVQALEWLVDNPTERRSMGRRARARVESEYSEEAAAHKTEEVYHAAIAGVHRRGWG